ncbi:MAG: VTT domain-containing protein [Burkholderiales bacterium]
MTDPAPARLWPLALLAALTALGIAAHALGLVDAAAALAWARTHAAQWWFPVALVALQVLLFTFGLPGSAVLWLAAPLYAPAAATLLLTSGGCAGALAAYAFARRLAGASLDRLHASSGYRILQREGDFLVLCALRVAPGMPHSVLNYAAGVLRLPLGPFMAAAAVGFSVKAYLYSSVIHQALAAGAPAELLAPATLWPLVALVAVLLAARALHRRRT